MRKFLFFASLLIIAILAASLIVWSNKASLAAHFLSRQLHVPVTLRTLDIGKTRANLNHLWIGTPPQSKISTSFSAEQTEIHSTLEQVLGNPLLIDAIVMSNIFVGLEYYDAQGKKTNWTYILYQAPHKKKKKERDYLIRTLVLENLTVEVTQANGQTKRYPTIPRMEFHNISSETGFPVEEIEKAIFHLMMQDLLQKLPIKQLLKQLSPFQNLPGNSPLKYLPNLIKP